MAFGRRPLRSSARDHAGARVRGVYQLRGAGALIKGRVTGSSATCALAALPSIVGAPWIGKGAQRLEKDDEVGLLPRAEVERLRGFSVLRVETDRIETGVVAHHLGEGLDAAVAAIGRGEYQIAQGRHLELAGTRLLQRRLARARGARARLVVVVGAEQVEAAFHQLPDSGLASGILLSARSELRQAGREELAAGEIGSGMAGGAAAFSDENLQPP